MFKDQSIKLQQFITAKTLFSKRYLRLRSLLQFSSSNLEQANQTIHF